MCIAFWVYGCPHPKPLFLLAFNRDEFFKRPAEPLHVWNDGSGLVAGRDLDGGGTWLGVNARSGRIAFLTNLRSGDPVEPSAHTRKHASRGGLTTTFLNGEQTPQEFTQALRLESYNGFNLVVGDLKGYTREVAFVYVNNEANGVSDVAGGEGSGGAGDAGCNSCSGADKAHRGRTQPLEPGRVYGLSNGQLGEWPKVTTGVQVMEDLLPSINYGSPVPWERIYDELMGDRRRLVPPAAGRHSEAAAQLDAAQGGTAHTAQGTQAEVQGATAGGPSVTTAHGCGGDASADGGNGTGAGAAEGRSYFHAELEHLTSGRFVEAVPSPYGLYGTRCQTAIVVWHDGTGEARERHLHEDGVWRESVVPLQVQLGGECGGPG